MTPELPFADFDPSKLDDLLKDVELAVDDAFLAEVDAALDRIRIPDDDDAAAA
jgi:hypothetical protein